MGILGSLADELFHGSSDALVVINNELAILDYNPQAGKMLGYPYPELIATPFMALALPQARGLLEQVITRGSGMPADTGTPEELFLLEYPQKNGQTLRLEAQIGPYHPDMNARMVRLRETAALARVEQELERTETRLRSTLDSSLQGCQIVGYDWTYLYVNDAAARQGRMPKEQLVGRTMIECYPGIEKTGMFQVLSKCMQERTHHRMENEFQFEDGSSGWFELSIQPVPEGIFILSLDVTERRNGQLQIERHMARLEALHRIDHAILNTTDIQYALKTVLQETRDHLEVDGAFVSLLNPHNLMLETAAAIGLRTPANSPLQVRLGDGIPGKAGLERRLVSAQEHYELSDESLAGPNSLVNREGAQAVYAAPLIVKGNLIGTLTGFFRHPFRTDRNWEDFFVTLAGQTAIAVESAESFQRIERANFEITAAYDTTIEGWSNALDLRDKETVGHSARVTDLTLRLARAAHISEPDLPHLRRGALLHDIGKMGVPDAVLYKPDSLTEAEWKLMRMHPVYAYQLLSGIPYLVPALDIPYCHHEKWDGTGYPRGLKGDLIPLSARLFAVVDVWDALRSDRPYRKAWSTSRVRDHISQLSGTHFDPTAVDLFFHVFGDQLP